MIRFELPRGKACVGCHNLEMENSFRGWCTLEAPVVCHKEYIDYIIEYQSSGNSEMGFEDEWVELEEFYGGKVRKDSLNDICRWWLEDMGLLTPKQLKHIKKAMSIAIFEQKVLAKLQSLEEKAK